MTTMASLRKERQKRKQLANALAKWKAWAKQTGLAHTSVKSGARQIETAKYPGRTVNAVIREFASRPVVPEPQPERADYSDRTEKLANTYRKIAPAMQAADLRCTQDTWPPRYSPKFGNKLEPMDRPLSEYPAFEPIPNFLRRT